MTSVVRCFLPKRRASGARPVGRKRNLLISSVKARAREIDLFRAVCVQDLEERADAGRAAGGPHKTRSEISRRSGLGSLGGKIGAVDDDVVGTTLPHSSFGNPDCCGCLNAFLRGDRAEIICNECEVVVRTVAIADLQRTLDEMELTLDLATVQCPHCGEVNLFPGLSKVLAFTCRSCGARSIADS